ncbi:MAG: 4Fe-4S ferredoxin [Deltaproteobacteria bacterium]|jgi:epoxyqueuosine reductase QueG|nr:4Fe-4S ferredoxin [Deltaproteobacteria bacterium]
MAIPITLRSASQTEESNLLGEEVKKVLELAAKNFLSGPANCYGPEGERIFAEPLFGYAAGDDPLWKVFARDIGEMYWTPEAAFERAFPGSNLKGEELSVAVIICPQTKATMSDQRRAVGFPSKRWVRSYFHHNQVIGSLSDHVAAALASAGVKACVPEHLEGYAQMPHPAYQIASPWSHRHAGFAAGLGTFGLCDGLITSVGKAHRLGSLILDRSLAPTRRAYQGPYDYCLWHSSGRCRKCVDRCPAGALSEKGHDKHLCESFLDSTRPKIKEMWPEFAGTYGCGLCQSAVPCDAGLPRAVKS